MQQGNTLKIWERKLVQLWGLSSGDRHMSEAIANIPRLPVPHNTIHVSNCRSNKQGCPRNRNDWLCCSRNSEPANWRDFFYCNKSYLLVN